MSDGEKFANVLMVDDNAGDILFERSVLTGPEGMNCNFLIAGDGHEGLATVRRQLSENDPVDLILLDNNLPAMNGPEMLRAVREDADLSRISVVMCSGSISKEAIEQAHTLGAIGCLAKPVFLNDLRPIIAEARNIRLVEDGAGRPGLKRVD
jgi:CheY-like chemotaxis protein